MLLDIDAKLGLDELDQLHNAEGVNYALFQKGGIIRVGKAVCAIKQIQGDELPDLFFHAKVVRLGWHIRRERRAVVSVETAAQAAGR